MAGETRAVWRPKYFFWISFAATCLVAVVAAYLIARLPAPTGMERRNDVTISDLLATLVTLSGITVPIAIAYLSLRSKDLEISLADRAIHELRDSGLTVEGVRFSFLYLSDAATQDEPSDALVTICECLGMRDVDPASDKPFTKTAGDWLFGEEESSIYERYFHHGSDRETITWYAVTVGVSGIACFFMMYARYFGVEGSGIDGLEAFIIFFTFSINVITYSFLLKSLRCKDRIRRRGNHQIRLACRTAKSQILAVLATSEKLQQQMSADLRKAYEAIHR